MNRRLAHSVGSSPKFAAGLEALEQRRLMSAALPAVAATDSAAASAEPVVTLDWKGQPVEARSGQWILGLSGKSDLMRGRQAPAQVRALQRRLGGAGAAAQV